MSFVFFSYARADSEFALRLANDLRSLGAALWMDQLDLSGGTRWDQAVEESLKSCGGLLVILSPASVQSNNVLDEVNFALEQNKRVIPVLLQNCDIPLRLKRLHYVDFTVDYVGALADLKRSLLAAEIIQAGDSLKSPKEATTSGLAKPPQRGQFVVQGTEGWQATGIRIDKGDVVKIVYLSGTWRDPQTGGRINPSDLKPGGEDSLDCLSVKSAYVAYGGLIARIGEKVLPLNALEKTLAGEGELFLRSNSCDEHLLEYCDGNVTVEIEVS